MILHRRGWRFSLRALIAVLLLSGPATLYGARALQYYQAWKAERLAIAEQKKFDDLVKLIESTISPSVWDDFGPTVYPEARPLCSFGMLGGQDQQPAETTHASDSADPSAAEQP